MNTKWSQILNNTCKLLPSNTMHLLTRRRAPAAAALLALVAVVAFTRSSSSTSIVDAAPVVCYLRALKWEEIVRNRWAFSCLEIDQSTA